MKLWIYAGLLAVMVATSACSKRDSNEAGSAGVLNSATPLAAPSPDSAAGDTSADDPKTGLNTQRPDSQKDLQPNAPSASR